MDINGIKTAVCIKGKLNSLDAGNEYWSCEVVMPLASLCECTPESKKPVAGDYYRLNFSRVQWKVYEENGIITKVKREDGKTPLPEDNWVWAPTGVINIHYPELWGFLYFAKDNESFKIPDDEFVKWELRKLYYAEQIHLDLNGCYTDKEEVLLDILKEYSPIEENRSVKPLTYKYSVTPHTFEISCATKDGGEMCIFSDGKTKKFS
nr:carbohydrate-binding family 9-like protein [Lachnospiraceae bacterium]